jgi:hypothetical protein
MLVWNRAQYGKAGLDPDAAPGTWEEVAANGRALEDAGFHGFGLPGGKGWQVSIMWIILFAKYGGEYFGPDYAPVQFRTRPPGGENPGRAASAARPSGQPDLGLPGDA